MMLLLKAAIKKTVMIGGYTKKDGTWVRPHETTVIVSPDHDDAKVASGQGSHYEKLAHKHLKNDPHHNSLPVDKQAANILHLKTKLQKEANVVSDISSLKKKLISGKAPTNNEWESFLSADEAKQEKVMQEIAEAGKHDEFIKFHEQYKSSAKDSETTAKKDKKAEKVEPEKHAEPKKERKPKSNLPEGWSESSPGGMIANSDPKKGGIVDQAIKSKKWFFVANADNVPGKGGFDTREAAYEALVSAVDKAENKQDDGPKEGETKQGKDGTLVFKDGRWHKAGAEDKTDYAAALDDIDVLPKGNYKKQAFDELSKKPEWLEWSDKQKLDATMELYHAKQSAANAASNVVKFQKTIKAGGIPTAGQFDAFMALPKEKQAAILEQLSEELGGRDKLAAVIKQVKQKAEKTKQEKPVEKAPVVESAPVAETPVIEPAPVAAEESWKPSFDEVLAMMKKPAGEVKDILKDWSKKMGGADKLYALMEEYQKKAKDDQAAKDATKKAVAQKPKAEKKPEEPVPDFNVGDKVPVDQIQHLKPGSVIQLYYKGEPWKKALIGKTTAWLTKKKGEGYYKEPMNDSQFYDLKYGKGGYSDAPVDLIEKGHDDWLSDPQSKTVKMLAGFDVKKGKPTGVYRLEKGLIVVGNPENMPSLSWVDEKGEWAKGFTSSQKTQIAEGKYKKLDIELPAAVDDSPKEGDTKMVDGVEYVLQNGRWHKVGSDEPVAEISSAQEEGAPLWKEGDTAIVDGAWHIYQDGKFEKIPDAKVNPKPKMSQEDMAKFALNNWEFHDIVSPLPPMDTGTADLVQNVIDIAKTGDIERVKTKLAEYSELYGPESTETVFAEQVLSKMLDKSGSSEGYEVKHFVHSQKGHDVYSVPVPEHLSNEHYKEVAALAKKKGGFYSGYKVAPAIPGFHFKDEGIAKEFGKEAFKLVQGYHGATDQAEPVKESVEEPKNTVALADFKTDAVKPTLSKKAYNGENKVWFSQQNAFDLTAAGSLTIMGHGPGDYAKKKKDEFFAAKKAGYDYQYWMTSGYGGTYVFVKDGQILTEKGMADLMTANGRVSATLDHPDGLDSIIKDVEAAGNVSDALKAVVAFIANNKGSDESIEQGAKALLVNGYTSNATQLSNLYSGDGGIKAHLKFIQLNGGMKYDDYAEISSFLDDNKGDLWGVVKKLEIEGKKGLALTVKNLALDLGIKNQKGVPVGTVTPFDGTPYKKISDGGWSSEKDGTTVGAHKPLSASLNILAGYPPNEEFYAKYANDPVWMETTAEVAVDNGADPKKALGLMYSGEHKAVEGDIKSVNGVQYQLINGRWHKVSPEDKQPKHIKFADFYESYEADGKTVKTFTGESFTKEPGGWKHEGTDHVFDDSFALSAALNIMVGSHPAFSYYSGENSDKVANENVIKSVVKNGFSVETALNGLFYGSNQDDQYEFGGKKYVFDIKKGWEVISDTSEAIKNAGQAKPASALSVGTKAKLGEIEFEKTAEGWVGSDFFYPPVSYQAAALNIMSGHYPDSAFYYDAQDDDQMFDNVVNVLGNDFDSVKAMDILYKGLELVGGAPAESASAENAKALGDYNDIPVGAKSTVKDKNYIKVFGGWKSESGSMYFTGSPAEAAVSLQAGYYPSDEFYEKYSKDEGYLQAVINAVTESGMSPGEALAGLYGGMKDGPKEGDIKTVNGVQYQLINGRWHKIGGVENKDVDSVEMPVMSNSLWNGILNELKESIKADPDSVTIKKNKWSITINDKTKGKVYKVKNPINYMDVPQSSKILQYLGSIKAVAGGKPLPDDLIAKLEEKGYPVTKGSGTIKKSTKKKSTASTSGDSAIPNTVAPESVKAGVTDVSGWTKVGEKKGSNTGGEYLDKNGKKWYVKFPETESHARNELLANKFYKMLGFKVPDMKLVQDGGKTGIASKWQDGLKKGSPDQLAAANGAKAGFAVDAWLANWDVVGLVYDNLLIDGDGDAFRVDPGGSLLFRAQGAPKGDAFSNEVNELDVLIDPSKNKQSASVFAGTTKKEMEFGLRQLNKLKPSQIFELCEKIAPGDSEEENKALAEKLIARRSYILKKFDIKDQWVIDDVDERHLQVNPSDIPAPLDFNNWQGVAGKGLSGSKFFNDQNTKDSKALAEFAAMGDLVALKEYQYDAVDKETGAQLGKKSIIDHPSKHIKEQWADLVELLQSIAHPPVDTLPMPSIGGAGTVEEISDMVGFFSPELRVETIPAEHRMGFFMKIGQIDDPKEIIDSQNWGFIKSTSAWVSSMKSGFSKLDSVVRAYISEVQASGWINHVWSQGKKTVSANGNGGSYSGGVQSLTAHIYNDAVDIPENTILYRGMTDTTAGKSMMKQFLNAQPGLVIQNTDSMCTSYNEGHSWGGDVQMVIRCPKGSKGTPSFASGHFSSEHEITTLPGQRFVVTNVTKKSETSIKVECIMLPPHYGYIAELEKLKEFGKSMFVFIKRSLG